MNNQRGHLRGFPWLAFRNKAPSGLVPVFSGRGADAAGLQAGCSGGGDCVNCSSPARDAGHDGKPEAITRLVQCIGLVSVALMAPLQLSGFRPGRCRARSRARCRYGSATSSTMGPWARSAPRFQSGCAGRWRGTEIAAITDVVFGQHQLQAALQQCPVGQNSCATAAATCPCVDAILRQCCGGFGAQRVAAASRFGGPGAFQRLQCALDVGMRRPCGHMPQGRLQVQSHGSQGVRSLWPRWRPGRARCPGARQAVQQVVGAVHEEPAVRGQARAGQGARWLPSRCCSSAASLPAGASTRWVTVRISRPSRGRITSSGTSRLTRVSVRSRCGASANRPHE